MSAALAGDDRAAKRATAMRSRPQSIPRESKAGLSPKSARQSSPRGMRPLQVVRESPRSFPSTSSPSRQSSDARASASTSATSTNGPVPLTPRTMREPVRAATTGSRPGLRSSVTKLSSSLAVPARGTKATPSRIPGRGGSLSAATGPATRDAARGTGASTAQESAPILSGLLDSEQLAQLIAAPSSSQSRLVELLEEVNREITTILTKNDLDSSTVSATSVTTGDVSDPPANGHVIRRSSGRKPTDSRQAPSTQRHISTTSPSNRQASTTGIVSRLCNRVDSLQSSLKVFESKRRIGSSPLDSKNPATRQQCDSNGTAESESSIAGLSRLEDMLGRLESQVRASFPVPEEVPAEGSRQVETFEMGVLEQKKNCLEEEIILLMKQKQELESHNSPLVASAPTGVAVPAAQSWVRKAPVISPRVPVPAPSTVVADDQDSATTTPASPPPPCPAVASESTCRPVSPTKLISSRAPAQRAPLVPPVPLASLQRAVGNATTQAAQVSPLAGSCRAVCTPTVPHIVQTRAITPSVGRDTPPSSPRSYAAYPTLRSTMGYPAQTLSARRLQKASINGYTCSDPNGIAIQVVGLA